MIKLMKSTFFDEKNTKEKLANFIVESKILSMNEKCRQFEQEFTKKQGRKFAVLFNSGSSANLALIQALLNMGKLKKGDRIGFSALTWATNVMPLFQLGLVPVPLDCELQTLNVSSKILANQIDNLQGLFLTNVLGFSSDIQKIKQMCQEKNIIFIEDNCESLGSEVGGVLLGKFSLASTFSFFVGHHLSTIEGGMVCTDDENLAYELIKVRAHGWDRNLPTARQKQLREDVGVDDFYALYTFHDLAYGIRPTEITGFLGTEQLKHLDLIVKKREENFNKFHELAKMNENIISLNLPHMNVISNFAMPIVCKTKELAEMFKSKFSKIAEIRPIIAGDITRQPFYKKYSVDVLECPNTSFVHDNGFYFPNNPDLTEDEIISILDLLV